MVLNTRSKSISKYVDLGEKRSIEKRRVEEGGEVSREKGVKGERVGKGEN